MTRLFVLLAWAPSVGMAIDPVAILGVRSTAAGAETVVSWVPGTRESAWPWRQRIAGTAEVTAEVLEGWLEQSGPLQLVELGIEDAPSLSHLVEGALDQVLIGLSRGEA